MKLFLLADIHGASQNCLRALQKFTASEADYLVLLGDLLYHGPRNPLPDSYDPQIVYNALNNYSDRIIAIRGNCDAEVDQMVLNFNISEDFTFLTLKKRLVYLTHGHIYHPDNLPPGFSSGDVLAFGHIHLPQADRQADYFIANPGSCGLPKAGNPPSYGIIEESGIYIYDFNDNPLASQKF